VRLNPKNDRSYDNRGYAYSQKGDYDRAVADYDEAIKISPKNAEFYNDRGNAFFGRGDYDQAIADYDQALKIDPKNDLVFSIGVTLIRTKAITITQLQTTAKL
jgi:tetratricopeptide (TPR) repeat protein